MKDWDITKRDMFERNDSGFLYKEVDQKNFR
jgi:hypothetical protein